MEILQCYQEVTLAGDIIYVNSVKFINTIYQHIKFIREEYKSNTYSKTLNNSIKQVKRFNKQRGFKVSNILIDVQFEFICSDLPDL